MIINATTPVLINYDKAKQLVSILRSTSIPTEQETVEHNFAWEKDHNCLANCYLVIVAICHQTSPIGERPLQGVVNGKERHGWDYLKERFLFEANRDDRLALPEFWQVMSPYQLADLYKDNKYGLTLNRINERCFLVNDLGRWLNKYNYQAVSEAFKACNETISGGDGFITFLKGCEAYTDPLAKKAFFFITLAVNECHWLVRDPQNLLSPVDYHELRGHLRVGTVTVCDQMLSRKLEHSLPITQSEDLLLRGAVQQLNDWIASETGISNSILHYLFWNVFRNCCSRSSQDSHCSSCSDKCMLPKRYKDLPIYEGQCLFAKVCNASNQSVRFVDPPYWGHYY